MQTQSDELYTFARQDYSIGALAFHPLKRIKGVIGAYFAMALSPDESRLALAGNSPITLWDLSVTPPQQLMMLTGHQDWISHLAFTPDGTTLVSSGGDGVRVWHAEGPPKRSEPVDP